ncbi:glycosyltransferase family 4 protein [Candidatus Gottesmanbacteria bacterium]|nr:glycosyltransferase family 4 protein [Candidatus Gottesmanbacteria bacterium]
MKICFLTDAWLPVWGGGQEHVLQVSKILKADVVYPKSNFFSFWNRVSFTLWTIKFYLTSNYDLYHSHSFSTNLFLPLAKLRGKKTAVTIHGLGKDLIGGGILNKFGISKFLLWLVLYVWPYDYKFSAGKLNGFVIIGNGVNIDEFNKFKSLKDKDKFRIFWIGRKYDPIKGVKYLEQAVKEINDPRIFLDIAENIYGEEKVKRFKKADLFVLSSLSEGLPIVLLEAMAAKLPIIATDVGDCREIIEKAKCGAVVAPGSIEELTKAIEKIAVDKRRNEMGQRGFNYVKKYYSWDKVVAKIYHSYEKI